MYDFKGRTAFITGGASGIGLAMARVFGFYGMRVAIADVERPALAEAESILDEEGVETLVLDLDVSDRQAMEEAAVRTEESFGNVHLVCNNAGVCGGGPLDQCTYDDWDWVLGVNLGGVVNGVQTFVHRLKAHGEGGHFVNTASIAPFALGRFGIYNTSKAAVITLSESLRADLKAHGIGVSVLCPGFVSTRIYRSDRNRPERFAETVWEDEPTQGEGVKIPVQGPLAVAKAVSEAVRDNEFWIFTHAEYKPFLCERHQRILDAFKEEPDPEAVAAIRSMGD